VKIADFHVQRNIELEVINNNKSKLVMKCKDSNCPWRMYAQHLDESLNQWGIMTYNGSESLNNVFRIARQLDFNFCCNISICLILF
jgi:hypothetical protein